MLGVFYSNIDADSLFIPKKYDQTFDANKITKFFQTIHLRKKVGKEQNSILGEYIAWNIWRERELEGGGDKI